MKRTEFLGFISSKYSPNSVSTRLYGASQAEKLINEDLDVVVADDELMAIALQQINTDKKSYNSKLKNALRTYYIFRNEKAFTRTI